MLNLSVLPTRVHLAARIRAGPFKRMTNKQVNAVQNLADPQPDSLLTLKRAVPPVRRVSLVLARRLRPTPGGHRKRRSANAPTDPTAKLKEK